MNVQCIAIYILGVFRLKGNYFKHQQHNAYLQSYYPTMFYSTILNRNMQYHVFYFNFIITLVPFGMMYYYLTDLTSLPKILLTDNTSIHIFTMESDKINIMIRRL